MQDKADDVILNEVKQSHKKTGYCHTERRAAARSRAYLIAQNVTQEITRYAPLAYARSV